MKQLLFAVMLIAVSLEAHSQSGGFPVYDNGLIYSDVTITKLRGIVDSLHLKYRQCDLTKKYYSIPQGVACYIVLKTGNIASALKEIENNISYSAFVKKHKAAVYPQLLITQDTDSDYYKKSQLVYRAGRPGPHDNITIRVPGNDRAPVEKKDGYVCGRVGNWVFNYNPSRSYRRKELEAFYITRPPSATEIPATYAKQIQYADCMIDTSSDVFLKDARDDRIGFILPEDRTGSKMDRFMQYVDTATGDVLQKYHLDTSCWRLADSLRWTYIGDSLSGTPVFKQQLSGAVEEVLRSKQLTDDGFEYYVGRYHSESTALTLKRSRRVFGHCSMDVMPGIHMMEIAFLAAETANWEVFLRAHLNILNDRLDRFANSSYGQARRKTYIKEIEELDINVEDLLLGISFDISNPSGTHYFGDIGRLGRAFAETKNHYTLEQKILSAIEDPPLLDNYNRLAMYNLFLNYTYYLPEKEHRMACLAQLEAAGKNLPAYLLPKEQIDKKVFENGPE